MSAYYSEELNHSSAPSYTPPPDRWTCWDTTEGHREPPLPMSTPTTTPTPVPCAMVGQSFGCLPRTSQLRVLQVLSQEIRRADAHECGATGAEYTTGDLPAPPDKLVVFEDLPRPKRPANAFILWSSTVRGQLNSGKPANDSSGKLRDRWKIMSDVEKAPWRAQSQELFAKFKERHPEVKYHPPRKAARKSKRSVSETVVSKSRWPSPLIQWLGGAPDIVPDFVLPLALMTPAPPEQEERDQIPTLPPFSFTMPGDPIPDFRLA
jgi:hypothetical protein